MLFLNFLPGLILLVILFFLLRLEYNYQQKISENFKYFIIKTLKVNFDPRGRLSLFDSWTYSLLINFLVFIISIIFFSIDLNIEEIIANSFDSKIEGFGFFEWFLFSLFIYRMFIVPIKRLRDLNKSGLRLFFAFIPVIGLFVFFYYMIITSFVQGTKGENRFGPDPRV